MSSMPVNSQQSFLPTTLIIPSVDQKEEFNYVLTDFIKKMIAAINEKDISQYLLEEIQNGQKFFDPVNTNNLRGVYRKTLDFGPLPDNTTIVKNHGITITPQTRFTRIYGVANDPDTSFIPLPFASAMATEGIRLEVTSTGVEITTVIDYSTYIETFIILEYIQGS